MSRCSNCRWSVYNAANLQIQLKDLNGQGGDAIIWFGGTSYTPTWDLPGGWTADNGRIDLGTACSSVSVAATEIENLVTYFSASRLDIEPYALSNHIDVDCGDSALARVRSWSAATSRRSPFRTPRRCCATASPPTAGTHRATATCTGSRRTS